MKRLLSLLLLGGILLFPCRACAKGSLLIADGSYDAYSLSLKTFRQENPDIRLSFDTAPDIHGWMIWQLLERSPTFDIYRLSSQTNLPGKLVQRGFAEEIDISERQMEWVGMLYPAVQSTILYDGRLRFVPTSIQFPYLFTVNKKLLQEAGLTMDDLPNNLMELFAFIAMWNRDYAGQYPELTPFYAHGFGYIGVNDLVGLVLNMYRDSQVFTNGTLRYDTDLFRALMLEAQAYTVPASQRAGGDVILARPQEDKCLIYCRSANTDSLFERSDSALISPLSIADGYQRFQPFALELAFVNPFSRRKANAHKLLSYYLDAPDPVLLCAVSKALAKPVENENFEESRAQWLAAIAGAQAKLEKADEADKAELIDTLATMQSYLERQEEFRYRVSEAAIAEYQERLAPYLTPRGNTPFDSHLVNDNVKTHVSRFLDGAIGIEELVKELDQTVGILSKEDS
ncbi:MAG: hypothetical protein MR842_09305 [Clostridiales bacterium]|nr:hypothetical protein [Clostridiales bacterium]MCI6377937.1 hypothetical protein [Clostridiales bacterium]MDY4007535.1 hypothetical protein [Candidatus Limiplasma sp.]